MEDVDINLIVEGDRGRKEYRNIEALAESINIKGLLQPIVLETGTHKLIAGGRRLRAHQLLGRPTIKAIYRDELTELQLRELELEENIQREDLTWVEKVNMTAEIDRLKRELYGSSPRGRRWNTEEVLGPEGDGGQSGGVDNPFPGNTLPSSTPGGPAAGGWTQSQTAEALGVNQATVSKSIAMSTLISLIPELANEPDAKSALKKFLRYAQEAERELAVRQFLASARENPTTSTAPEPRLGTALDILRTRPDHSVDLFLFDPPYGVNLDSENIGRYQATGSVHFADTPESALATFAAVLPDIRRVLKPDGHLYCFCGIKVLGEVLSLLSQAGLEPDSIPLVWIKNTDMLVDFNYRFSGGWEPIVFCPSSRMLSRKRSSVFTFDAVRSTEKANVAEKPTDLLKELILMSTREGEVVYDPFAGSGSTLVAATELGRVAQGSEQDIDQWNGAILRVHAAEEARQPAPSDEEEETIE